MSMSIYVMPNGRKYRFEDGEAPAEAVKVVKKVKAQPKPETKEKAKKTANKSKKTTNKAKKVEDK